jgi:hypothetical protein
MMYVGGDVWSWSGRSGKLRELQGGEPMVVRKVPTSIAMEQCHPWNESHSIPLSI